MCEVLGPGCTLRYYNVRNAVVYEGPAGKELIIEECWLILLFHMEQSSSIVLGLPQ